MVTVRQVVAEPVRGGFEDGEGLHVGLFLHGVRATRCEGHRRLAPAALRRRPDGRATAEDDQVGERDLLAA